MIPKYIHNLRAVVQLLFPVILVYSCSVPEPENMRPEGVVDDLNTLSRLDIPDGFDFSTHRSVTITINDDSNYVKYDVFAYSPDPYNAGYETFENQSGEIVTEQVFKNDVLNKQLFSGVPKDGVLTQTVNIPKFSDKVYIRRNDNLNFSADIADIVNGEVSYSYSSSDKSGRTAKNSAVNDYLYCVNGSAELFQVDPLDGALTYLSDMPMGSWTCAIDQENKTLYSIGRSSPYPLMKYYIETNTWEIVANLGIGGPRLDYNDEDGLLYFSTRDKLYTFDPATGENLNIWNINGLHNTNGGDLAFAEDGTLYLCTFSGLYRLELDANNEYQSTRISADNLPFQPTSMTFDSNQELWLANNASSSDLIIMDTVTGGWEYRYGVNANNNTDFGRTINDLTTFRVPIANPSQTDTDGDGIVDRDDSFPEDPEKAFELYTPSKYGTGTIAFEDLWPSRGDYDFNDMALNYQAIAMLNAQNLVVQLDFVCYVKVAGAGFVNGVGFEMEGTSPNLIESINGQVIYQDYISLNGNGTEANQENAVVILADNADRMMNETTISIKFTQPISTSALGTAPFNPFIIVNMEREKEVHLPYAHKTSLAQESFQIAGINNDPDGNYISEDGRPWAISIIHDFKVPKESVAIHNAYNFFNQWALSGGIQYADWYKDNPGYRNAERLER